MNRWTYTRHRFADRAAWVAIRGALGWADAMPDTVLVVEPGALTGRDGVPLSGWHVDIAWRRGTAPPAALAASTVTPAEPLHGWA